MFCPKCKRLMRSTGSEWCCTDPKCGNRVAIEGSHTIRQESRESRDRLVLDDDRQGTLPTVDVECPKCGNNKASWRLRQMRAADEPETRLFRCTKCQHTWRDNA